MTFPLLAAGIDQFLPLAFLLVMLLVLKWVQRPKKEDQDFNAAPDDSHERSEESLRKLMEALGLPENAPPPPAVLEIPRSAPIPPVIEAEPLLPKPLSPPTPPPVSPLPIPPPLPIHSPIPEKERRVEGARIRSKESRVKEPLSESLQGALRNPSSLRRAIIMREILGPPKSLES